MRLSKPLSAGTGPVRPLVGNVRISGDVTASSFTKPPLHLASYPGRRTNLGGGEAQSGGLRADGCSVALLLPPPQLLPCLNKLLDGFGWRQTLAFHRALFPRLPVDLLNAGFTQPCQVLLKQFQLLFGQWALGLRHRSDSISCSSYLRLPSSNETRPQESIFILSCDSSGVDEALLDELQNLPLEERENRGSLFSGVWLKLSEESEKKMAGVAVPRPVRFVSFSLWTVYERARQSPFSTR